MERAVVGLTFLLASVTGLVVVPTATASATTAPVAGAFTALAAPVRFMDTRPGGSHIGPNNTLGQGQAVDLQIEGQGGIPAGGVGAVALNVTVVSPTSNGYLTVFPAGGSAPNTSNLNFVPGQVVPNAVTVGLSSGGAISLFNSGGSTDVVVDVAGYYTGGAAASPGTFTPITPTRLMDTRPGALHIGPNNTLGWGQTASLQVGSTAAVPAGAGAVVMNVTAVAPTSAGYVSVFPDGSAQPNVSNLNFTPGQVEPNQVTVKLGSNGRVDFYNNAGNTDLIADVSGYYLSGTATAPGAFVPLTPTRVLDTRNGTAAQGGQSVTVDPALNSSGVPAAGVSAVVANVTVTNPSVSGYLTAYPTGTSVPNASNLNFNGNQTVPNAVVVGTGGGNHASLFLNAGSADLVVDIEGYYLTPDFHFGPGIYTGVTPSSLNRVDDLACSSATFCVAAGQSGVAGYDGSSWTMAPQSVAYPYSNSNSVSCAPGANFCLIAEGVANSSSYSAWIYQGTGVWTSESVGMAGWGWAVSCSSPTFCMVVGSLDASGNVAQYAIYDGSTWTVHGSSWSGGPGPRAVSCQAPTSCQMGGNGTIATFDGTSWSPIASMSPPWQSGQPVSAMCVSATICLAAEYNAPTYYRYDGAGWSGPNTYDPTSDGTEAESCSTDGVACAMASRNGQFVPLVGTAQKLSTSSLMDVTCPSATFCMAIDGAGYVYAGTFH